MARALAINVAANTTLPGFRGPVYPDGSFEYVPIPEREPIADSQAAPTYADLDLEFDVPASLHNRHVHHDPAFAGIHGADRYTYGDEHGVKAGPISRLTADDWLFFYATLSSHATPDTVPDDPGHPPAALSWLSSDWGTYLIGCFRIHRVVTGEEYAALSEDARSVFAGNAHLNRECFDARVLVAGAPESRLFERVVPLSTPEAGSEPNRLVTEVSADSGRGPWWRRPLRFDPPATDRLRSYVARDPAEWLST